LSGKVKVLFDASSYPGYAEIRKKHLRTVRFITANGAITSPLVFLLVWIMLEVVTDSGIDGMLLGAVLFALFLIDEIAVFALIRPMLLRGWKVPTRITEEGILRSDRLFLFSEIDSLSRFGFYLMIENREKGAKVPLLNAQLGDVDEFIKVVMQQAPRMAFKDMR
jgi:hypothetical protein